MLDSISPSIGNFTKPHVNTALGISNLARDVSEIARLYSELPFQYISQIHEYSVPRGKLPPALSAANRGRKIGNASRDVSPTFLGTAPWTT